VPDFEPFEFEGVGIPDSYNVHLRRGRAVAQPVDHRFDSGFFTLDMRFDISAITPW
jgi:hypothetical protein